MSDESIFARLFSSLFSSNDPEAKKKKRLRSIAKDLSKSKYHFYKNEEVMPSMAKFFYEVYKATASAQAFFNSVENPNTFKYMVVNHALTDKQHEISEELSKEAITAKAANVSMEQLQSEIKEKLSQFLGAFDAERITKIEATYKKLMAFKNFCTYDFYFMLKKFDSTLREREFNSIPKFEKINAEYIAEDLKDFISIASPVTEISDWTDMMKMFKEVKGQEPVNPAIWNKIVVKLRSIISTRTFDMMLKLMTKNPDYIVEYEVKEEPIVDSYLEKIRQEAENTLSQLVVAQKNSKIGTLLNQIFGTTDVVRLHYYTEQASAPYERKSLGKFLYAGPLNYYKAFLLDYVKKDLREFSDLLLIRGTWSSNTLSTPMSNAYNALLESSDAVTRFDERISEEGDIGLKLKTILPRAERDKEARNIINTILNDLNNEAKTFCIDATRNLVAIAKIIKPVMEDYAKPKGELIINWKELDKFADHPIKQLGTDVYKHIYLFVTLMQNCFASKAD
ncbi:DUF5312 family protein [Treponema sp.]|uniref:DUF5312 family protein n=1 Tax=Treponema sp. TaxID=166 RepID=UPI00298D92D5|nr:DUF5312 family protein [Treponema sp.]MCR5613110.1 DUF5312 family protein [Treponema sp.]